MKLRKFFLVLLVFFFITPVSLAGAKTSFQGVGLGSPLSAWKTAWGSASHASTYCQDATACWGPPTINNTTGATFLFTTVFFEKGVTTGFTINLANNSPYANALHALKYTMPSDATYGKLIPTNSGYGSACALMYGKPALLCMGKVSRLEKSFKRPVLRKVKLLLQQSF